MARKSLGNLELSSFTLHSLEEALRHSFEARRGKLYHALRAMNAMLVVDLVRQATLEDFTQLECEELAWTSLRSQVEEELMKEFRFAYVVGNARRKFQNLDGVMQALEPLVDEFVAEYATRAADGALERKGGVIRWLTGTQEVGSIADLLKFANASFWFAQNVLDNESGFEHLAPKVEELYDLLPR